VGGEVKDKWRAAAKRAGVFPRTAWGDLSPEQFLAADSRAYGPRNQKNLQPNTQLQPAQVPA
jgi:hypothetical protein